MKMHHALVAIALLVSAFSNVTHAGAEKACPTGEGEMKKWERSVVITDQRILKQGFSFKRTIQAILKSGGLNDGDADVEAAVQSLINTFKQMSEKHPIGGRMVRFKERAAEAEMNAKFMLNEAGDAGMIPIGLFNRFDQAPDCWAYCGEHRIVYARKLGRFFLNFEAAVANPRPDLGKDGCKPIAEMWQSLKTKTDDQITDIAKSLQEFYYSGLPSPDNSFQVPQALHINHFGNPFGQVRGNFFMQGPWQLREWHIDPATGAFRMHVLGTNPQPGFYGGEGPSDIVKSFQENFVQRVVPKLLEADSKLTGVSNIEDQKALLINNIGILPQTLEHTVDPWDDFVSNSQEDPQDPRGSDDPEKVAEKAFKDKIKGAITKAYVRNVNADQILVRAGATSCGGCHHFSSMSSEIGKDSAGNNIMWPGLPSSGAPSDFVHINEEGKLSELLTKFFLADRCEKMNEIFFKPEGASACIISEPNALSTMLRQTSPTALLNLRKQISSTPLQPSLKEPIEQMIRQIAEERNDKLRAVDRSTRGALGQIRHAD